MSAGAHRIRRHPHIVAEAPRQLRGERRERARPARLRRERLGLQFEQPRPAVGAFERAPGRSAEVGELLGERVLGEMRLERIGDRRCDAGDGIEPQHAHQEPMHVHRRVPVVAAVERRMQAALAELFARTGHEMLDVPRVFAHDVRERNARQPACKLLGQHCNRY